MLKLGIVEKIKGITRFTRAYSIFDLYQRPISLAIKKELLERNIDYRVLSSECGVSWRKTKEFLDTGRAEKLTTKEIQTMAYNLGLRFTLKIHKSDRFNIPDSISKNKDRKTFEYFIGDHVFWYKNLPTLTENVRLFHGMVIELKPNNIAVIEIQEGDQKDKMFLVSFDELELIA